LSGWRWWRRNRPLQKEKQANQFDILFIEPTKSLIQVRFFTSMMVGSTTGGGVGAFSLMVSGGGVGAAGAVWRIIIGGCDGGAGICFSLMMMGAGGGGVGGCRYLIFLK
jgi:hypothetical protein